MSVAPFRDWLTEQEQKRRPLIYLLEWICVFAFALLFWVFVLFEIRRSVGSVAAAAAVSSLYASAFVYLRLLQLTTCAKCGSPLVFSQEIGRRYLNEVEKCLEIERGGEEWYGHFIDVYSRRYRVEIVKYRCRRCHSLWAKETEVPACDYVLVRSIELKD